MRDRAKPDNNPPQRIAAEEAQTLPHALGAEAQTRPRARLAEARAIWARIAAAVVAVLAGIELETGKFPILRAPQIRAHSVAHRAG